MLNRMAGHLLGALIAARNSDAALIRAGKKMAEPTTIFVGCRRHATPRGGARKHHKKSRSKAAWRGAIGTRVT